MSSGQIILTMGAIVLFMITALNVNRSILHTTSVTVDQQARMNAVNYGQSLVELIYSHPGDFESFQITYGNYDDVNDPDRRLNHTTETDEELAATISIDSKTNLAHQISGIVATVTVYELIEDSIDQKVVFTAALPIE